MRACFLLATIWAASAAAWQSEPAEARQREFRRALRAVLRTSQEQFKPMQGARIDIRPGNETWFQARLDLPGATSCRVYEHPISYVCQWEKAPGRSDLRAFHTALAADVEAALGDSWERTGRNGQVLFRGKDDGATITIATAVGAVRLAIAPGVRLKPADQP